MTGLMRTRIGRRAGDLARRAGGSALGVKLIRRIVSPLQRWLYRVSKGRLSLTGRAPVALLTTIGRRTGRSRTVPVFYVRDGRRFAICNVRPPGERTNPWVLNLSALPYAEVETAGQRTRSSARLATDREMDELWPRFVEIWPAFERFAGAGGERTVFILEKKEG